MTFDDIWPFILRWEGGLSDDADDAGGLTKYGVSYAFLKDLDDEDPKLLERIGVQLPITRDSVRSLTKDQAKAIFQSYFWDGTHCSDRLSGYPKVAFCLCDTAINMGRGTAIRMFQQSVGAKADGIVGPNTMRALWAVGDVLASQNMIHIRRVRYEHIAEFNPSQKKFLKGWLNRVADLEKEIANVD